MPGPHRLPTVHKHFVMESMHDLKGTHHRTTGQTKSLSVIFGCYDLGNILVKISLKMCVKLEKFPILTWDVLILLFIKATNKTIDDCVFK